jgi:hypothetical protein
MKAKSGSINEGYYPAARLPWVRKEEINIYH